MASTKAFYAQVAAGVLLACAIAERLGAGDARHRHRLLADAARAARRHAHACSTAAPRIAEAARRFAPSRRYWAVVGNGPNKVAAEEVRIKLSELCYKSIACDVTEDKKHIDLSSEPLILVCAAGLVGSTADDVAKEVAIYRAHKAAPIVIATRGRGALRRRPARCFSVPAVEPALAFVLSAMVGPPVRLRGGAGHRRAGPPAARGARGHRGGGRPHGAPGDVRAGPAARRARRRSSQRFTDGLRSGAYDGHLEASTAVQRHVAAALRRRRRCRSTRTRPSSARSARRRCSSTTSPPRSRGRIEELTRPVDAIKHQAKTVTVGISRQRRGPARQPRSCGGAGGRRRPRPAQLPHAEGRWPTSTRPSTAVIGFTRYRIEGDPERGDATHRDRRPRRPRRATCPRGSSATPSCAARSAGWPSTARCSWPAGAPTAAR